MRNETSVKIYFICTTGRTGYTYLQELLRSVKVLGRPGTARIDWTEEIIAKQIARAHRRNCPYGMKLPPLARNKILAWFKPDLLIHYYRRDLTRQAISHLRVIQNKIWIERESQERPGHDGLEYQFHMIHSLSERLRKAHRRIAKLNPDLTIIYEDVCQDPAGAVQQVAERLGIEIPPRVTPTTNMRIQRDELTEEWRRRFCKDLARLAKKAGQPALLQPLEPQDYAQ